MTLLLVQILQRSFHCYRKVERNRVYIYIDFVRLTRNILRFGFSDSDMKVGWLLFGEDCDLVVGTTTACRLDEGIQDDRLPPLELGVPMQGRRGFEVGSEIKSRLKVLASILRQVLGVFPFKFQNRLMGRRTAISPRVQYSI